MKEKKRRGGFRNGLISLLRGGKARIAQQLEEANRQLREAERMAGMGHWTLELETGSLFWSEQAYAIFGIPQGTEVDMELFSQCVHPDDRDHLLATWDEALKEGKVYEVEHRILIDGQEKWVRERADTSKVFDGKVVGTILDITAQKISEQKVLAASTRFTLAAKAAGVGVWEYDVVKNELQWDEQMYRLYGFGEERFQGVYESWQSGLHPEDRERGDREIEAALKGESDFNTTFRVIWPDQSIHHIRAMASVIRDNSGNPLRMIGTNWDITTQKQTELAFQKERERLQGILEGTHVGTWEWNVATGEVVFNERWAEIIGYRMKDLEPVTIDTWQEFAHPEDLREGNDKIQSHFRGELDYYDHEIRMKHRNGSWVWVHDRGRVMSWTDDGKPLLMMGTHQDITDKKEAEATLRVQEERFRKLFELAPMGMAINDLKTGQFIDVNDALIAPTGYTRDEFLKLTYWEITPREYEPREQEMLEMLQRTGRYGPYEKEYLRKDGTRYSVLLHGFMAENTQGDPFIWSIIEDVTEKKKSETRLRQLAQAVEQSPAAVAITDTEGKIQYVNSCFSKTTGYTSEEVLGQNPRIMKSNITDAETYQKLWATISSGKEWRGEIQNRHKQGHLFWESLIVSPIINEFGQVTHYVAIMEDITQRKADEEKLREANLRLEKEKERSLQLAREAELASQAKSEFLANMSHEIRTPMNGVIGMTGLLMESELNPKQRRQAEVVRGSAESLLGIINDILDFSKIEAGKLSLEKLPFNLIEMLEEFVEAMALRAHQKGLEMSFILSPSVPHWVSGDPGRIRQILTNLVSNALKFTEKGEIAIRVDGKTTKKGAKLFFKVKDTGIGIPAEKAKNLFQRFEQVDASTTRKFGGTGLGLAISRQLCEIMEGSISVTSEEGKGSIFSFDIHLESIATPPLGEAADYGFLKGRQILTIDDADCNLEVLEGWLTQWSAVAHPARSAPEGLQKVYQSLESEEHFDAILVDMCMPGMDGLGLARALKADPRTAKIPIVLLTSLGICESDENDIRDDLFVCELSKPFRHKDLLLALRKAILGSCESEENKNPWQKENSPSFRDLLKGRILLAEDNSINQLVAQGILEKMGLRADVVGNGLEAVNAVKTLPYDLIFMDIQMPEMDGLEASREIRRWEKEEAPVNHSPIPIVAMTAHAMQGDKEACLAAGMNAHVSKPVQRRELEATLRKWLLPERLSTQPHSETPDLTEPQQAFDLQLLVEELGLEKNLVISILKEFCSETPSAVQSIEEAMKSGEMGTVEQIAHSLKGSAGYLHVDSYSSIIDDLEKAAHEPNPNRVANLVPTLSQVHQHLVEEIKAAI